MEKGNTKTSSTSKSNSSDSKNKQDGITNKHLRLPRVKDSISPRPDTRRKSNPQRNRELFDKRPRNRTGAVYEKYRSEVTEGAVCEPLSNQGSKKTNLNHLLNFTLAPLDNWEGNGRRTSHTRPKFPKYNKELFLQANCQFVARDNGNYSVHQKNPDILVEWSLIEEIRLPCHEVPLCPICLYVPVAAKITRCGHVYCWPCMLHYLSLTDKTWQKCPICFEAVHKTELKSVSLRVRKAFTVGDEITLCLMQREKGSLFSTPVTHQKSSQTVCNVDDVDTVTRYQKLLLAYPKEVQLILNRERLELNQSYLEEKDTPEICFIESALNLLGEREHTLNSTMNDEKIHPDKELTEKDVNSPSVRKHLNSISSIESNNEVVNTDLNENSIRLGSSPITIGAVKNLSNEPDKGICFFYQAEDGQHIYLHNINVRMLLNEFGSLEFAPHDITAKLVEIERVTMTEVLRKRLRYLQHLPLTCEFQVVELDFSHVVSESTVRQFESEIKKRKFIRNRKARDERRREKMIEREENMKLGKYPKATYNLNSADQFPAYHPEDFLSLSPPNDNINMERQPFNPDISNVNSGACVSDYPQELASSESSYVPVTSFAQMLKDGPKTFTRKQTEVKPHIMASSHQLPPNIDSDGEDCTPAPEYRQSFSDAIQAALNSVTLQDSSDKNQGSSKKKKKGKKQLLFTTSMCRNK